MSADSAIPKFNKSDPKNLAGTRKEGEGPSYQFWNANAWALDISKQNGKVKEFFDSDCKEFIASNKERRETIRKKMRTIRSLSTNPPQTLQNLMLKILTRNSPVQYAK